MRKTTKEMIEVMQAYENGAEIEYFDPDDPHFKPLTEPLWNWLDFDYRVKPKPREIWVRYDPEPEIVSRCITPTCIKFREVMDDPWSRGESGMIHGPSITMVCEGGDDE